MLGVLLVLLLGAAATRGDLTGLWLGTPGAVLGAGRVYVQPPAYNTTQPNTTQVNPLDPVLALCLIFTE